MIKIKKQKTKRHNDELILDLIDLLAESGTDAQRIVEQVQASHGYFDPLFAEHEGIIFKVELECSPDVLPNSAIRYSIKHIKTKYLKFPNDGPPLLQACKHFREYTGLPIVLATFFAKEMDCIKVAGTFPKVDREHAERSEARPDLN